MNHTIVSPYSSNLCLKIYYFSRGQSYPLEQVFDLNFKRISYSRRIQKVRNFFETFCAIYIYSSQMSRCYENTRSSFRLHERLIIVSTGGCGSRERDRQRETKTVPLTRFQLSIEITFSATFSTNTHRPLVWKKGSRTELSNGSPVRLQKFDTSPWQPVIQFFFPRHSDI